MSWLILVILFVVAMLACAVLCNAIFGFFSAPFAEEEFFQAFSRNLQLQVIALVLILIAVLLLAIFLRGR